MGMPFWRCGIYCGKSSTRTTGDFVTEPVDHIWQSATLSPRTGGAYLAMTLLGHGTASTPTGLKRA